MLVLGAFSAAVNQAILLRTYIYQTNCTSSPPVQLPPISLHPQDQKPPATSRPRHEACRSYRPCGICHLSDRPSLQWSAGLRCKILLLASISHLQLTDKAPSQQSCALSSIPAECGLDPKCEIYAPFVESSKHPFLLITEIIQASVVPPPLSMASHAVSPMLATPMIKTVSVDTTMSIEHG
jgi:hypothetical protein